MKRAMKLEQNVTYFQESELLLSRSSKESDKQTYVNWLGLIALIFRVSSATPADTAAVSDFMNGIMQSINQLVPDPQHFAEENSKTATQDGVKEQNGDIFAEIYTSLGTARQNVQHHNEITSRSEIYDNHTVGRIKVAEKSLRKLHDTLLFFCDSDFVIFLKIWRQN